MCKNAFNTPPAPLSRGELKSCCRTRHSRWFWMGLRLSVAVTFLSCLLVFALASIYRADSQSDAAAIGDDSISRKQVIAGNGINPEIESSFPPEDATMTEKLSGKFKTLLQKTSLIHIFKKGGPIMWPLLFASILALGTVIERVIFLIGEQRKRDPQAMETFFSAVGQGDTEHAICTSKESGFYVVRVGLRAGAQGKIAR